MNDIHTKVFNVIAVTVVAIAFCFFSSWILFEFKDSSTSLRDTWSIVGSLFGGMTTLVAAYIATLLINDWKAQHDYIEKIKLLCEMLDVVSEVQDKLDSARDFPLISEFFEYKDLKKNLVPQFDIQFKKYEEIKCALHKLIKLENKVFLISNGGTKGLIFKDGEGYEAIQHLLKEADRLAIGASEFYDIITHEGSKSINAKYVDFDDEYMQHLLMRLHRSGELYLRLNLRVRTIPKSNIYTDKYEKYLNTIDQAILNYRDVLEKK